MLKNLLFQLILKGKQTGASMCGKNGVSTAGDLTCMLSTPFVHYGKKIHGTSIWYKTIPIGINSLRSTVSKLCQNGGIDGYKTNHSLRVTAATRLFHEGIDEQLIKERTGQKSIDGVRTYKRTCSEQHAKLSDVLHRTLSSATKKPKRIEKTEESTKTPLKTDLEQGEEVQNKQEMGRAPPICSLSATVMISLLTITIDQLFFSCYIDIYITQDFLHYQCMKFISVHHAQLVINNKYFSEQ